MLTADKARSISEFNKNYKFNERVKHIEAAIRKFAEQGLLSIGFSDVDHEVDEYLQRAGFTLTKNTKFTRPDYDDREYTGTVISWGNELKAGIVFNVGDEVMTLLTEIKPLGNLIVVKGEEGFVTFEDQGSQLAPKVQYRVSNHVAQNNLFVVKYEK